MQTLKQTLKRIGLALGTLIAVLLAGGAHYRL